MDFHAPVAVTVDVDVDDDGPFGLIIICAFFNV